PPPSRAGGSPSAPPPLHGRLAPAAHPCAALRNPRPGTTIGQSLAWFRKSAPSSHRSISRSEPRPGGWGSRQAKHGCFARESGQDALTERKAIPGRQGVASVRSPDVALLPYCIQFPSIGRRTKKKAAAPEGTAAGTALLDQKRCWYFMNTKRPISKPP